jgi:hypothetical protein
VELAASLEIANVGPRPDVAARHRRLIKEGTNKMAAVVQVKFVVSDAEGLAKLANWKSQVQSLGNAGGGGINFGKGLADVGREAERAGGLTDAFRESVHVLHPVLASAGIELGVFGGLARAAGGGIVAFAAAAVGTGAVALAKLGEQAKKTKEEIDALYGPKAAPGAQQRIEEGATRAGTTSEGLLGTAATIRDALTLRRRPATAADKRPEQEAEALIALSEKYGATPDDAQKRADAVVEAFKKQAQEKPGIEPKLNAAILDNLPRGAGNEIARLLGAPNRETLDSQIQSGRAVSLQQILSLLDLRGPGFIRDAGAQPPEKKSIPGEFQKLYNQTTRNLAPEGEALDTGGVKLLDFLNDAARLPPGRQSLQNRGLGLLLKGLSPAIGPLFPPAPLLSGALPNLYGASTDRLQGLMPLPGETGASLRGGGAPQPLPWVQQMLDAAPRSAPSQPPQPSAQQSQSETEVMQPIQLTINDSVIAEAVARIAVRTQRTSTGDKPYGW